MQALTPKGIKHLKRHSGGFSLIELLVVMAILLIVMAAVMGTLDITRRASFTNTQLVDAQQNLRSAAKFMSDEIVTQGSEFMGQVVNDSVMVRTGFLAARGFPTSGVTWPTSGTVRFDELFAVQAANNTISSTALVGRDSTGTAISNLRVYDGSGPRGNAALNHQGTDQLILVQAEKIDLQFEDDYGLLKPDTNTDPEIAEAKYQAIANLSGSNLRLDPIVTTPATSNLNSADTAGLINAFEATDRLLANRLQPNVDCVIIQDTAAGQQFLGLVTAVTGTGQIQCDFNDVISVNPDWSIAVSSAAQTTPPTPRLCAPGAVVNIRKGKLIRYFIGSPITGSTGNPINNSILYRQEGARIDPVAFGIENMQCTFFLIDEADIGGDGKGQFYMIPSTASGPGSFLGAGAWTGAPTAPSLDAGRTLRWDRTAVRAVITKLYARSDAKDPKLIGPDNTLSAIDRGYYHVEQEFTTSLRNAAYNR